MRYQNLVSFGHQKFVPKFTHHSSLGLELDVQFPIFNCAYHGWLKPTESQDAGVPKFLCSGQEATEIYNGKSYIP